MSIDQRNARYGDFSSGQDFQESQEKIARFTEMFDSMPADVRKKFSNNPAEFIDFVAATGSDENKRKEAIELGILPKPKVTREIVDNGDGTKEVVHKRDGVEFDRTEYVPPPSPTPPAS